jgi:pyridoxine kinase
MEDLCSAPWLGSVGGIISGYLGAPGQAASIKKLVERLRTANPDAFYLCDPVIGDAGRLYVGEDTAVAIRDQLVPIADLVTPNLSELHWLTRSNATSHDDIRAAACELSKVAVIVTSAPGPSAGHIGNMHVSSRGTTLASHPVVADPPKGAGDLLAALFMAHHLSGGETEAALSKATASVYQIITDTKRDGADELALAKYSRAFANPVVEIEVAHLAPPNP